MRRTRGTTEEVEDAAVRLRRELTPAEQVLWEAIRDRLLAGAKFRRQHPVGSFILDFCCAAKRLAIEVDGGVHNQQIERDAARTAQLAAHGYRVLRFSNEDVLRDLPTVLARVEAELANPSPTFGRGVARSAGVRAPGREEPSPPSPLSQLWEKGSTTKRTQNS